MRDKIAADCDRRDAEILAHQYVKYFHSSVPRRTRAGAAPTLFQRFSLKVDPEAIRQTNGTRDPFGKE